MTWSSRDTYVLDLRGLGVIWFSRPDFIPALSTFGEPIPESRRGIIGVGSTLRSSVGLFDPRSRPGGLAIDLTADAALELMREGGDPVRDPSVNRVVWAVIPHDEYWSSDRTTLWFREARGASTTPLTTGASYIVGTEVVHVVSQTSNVLDGAREYNVLRGQRGSQAKARPVYWPEGSDLLNSPDGLGNQIMTQLDPVYPDLAPPTLTGWPARVWRFSPGGGGVVFDGVVSRVRSNGARITVELEHRVEAELSRPWQVPWGGMLRGTGLTFAPARPVLVDAFPQRFPGAEVFGVGSDERGSIRLAPGGISSRGPIIGVPANSLPASDLDQYNAVLVRFEEGWVACTINQWLTTPFDATVDGHTFAVDDDRWRWAELLDDQGEGGARVQAHGQGDSVRGLRGGTVAWLRSIGIEPELLSFSGADLYRVQREQLDELGTDVTPCYLLPIAGDEQWAPDVLPPAVQEEMGAIYRYADLGATNETFLRPLHTGRSVAEVVDVQLGGQGKALSFSPLGEPQVIDWIGLPPGTAADLVATDLREPVTTEIGQPGRISRLEIEVDGDTVTLAIVGRSLSPRGVEVERDIDAVVLGALEESVRARISSWAAALGVYRGTIPVARFAVRDDGTGKLDALRPGALVSLEDPALPAADGTRGFTGAALLMDVAVGTESRTAVVTALLQAYGRQAPARWGPVVRVDSGGTGTTINVDVLNVAAGRGIARFAQLVAIAPVPLQRVSIDGPIASAAVTLTAIALDGTATVTAASSITIDNGEFLVMAPAPAPAALPFATGYYDVSEYR